MSETDRPDALGLAELMIEAIEEGPAFHVPHFIVKDAAAELRRLTEVNQELVESLQKCWMVMNHGGTWTLEDQAKARAAIAKIKGESNE